MTFDTQTHSANHKRAWGAGLVLLVMMAGHTVLETARDSLFLARVPVSQLPWTYASIAVAALLAAELNGRLRFRLGHRSLLTWTLGAGAAGGLVFLQLFRVHVSWAPYAFYVWIAVIATLATVQFWLLVSELFTVLEAKQLYSLISAGGLLGAMLGGAIARETAARFGDVSLLVVGAVLFALTALVSVLTPSLTLNAVKAAEPYLPPSDAGSTTSMRDLRTERYLQRLLVLTLLSTLTATLIDYLFKAQIAQSVPASKLGKFFGTFNVALNATALFAQFVIAPRLLRSAGVGRSLMLLPAALALSSLGVLAAPAFLSVLILRGADGSLRYSLHRSSLEVLYMPLSMQARARWKMVIDVLGQRGGQAIAAVTIFGCIALALSVWQMAALVLVLSVVWLGLSLTIESGYVALFRAKIKAGAIETRSDVPALDLLSLESLVAALGSDNDDEVLASIDLLVDYDRVRVIPALLLYHPSRAVVMRTLEVFATSGRRDAMGATRRLLDRNDDEIRAAAMLSLAGQMEPSELRSELSADLPIAARAAVLVAMLARGLDQDGSCAREVDAGCEPSAGGAMRLAFARAFRMQGGAAGVTRLPKLLIDARPELELETAQAMLATPDERYMPELVRMLGSRVARGVARDALLAIGDPALQELAHGLADDDLPRRLRAHLPRSISRFGSAAAADILLDRLEREPDGWVRFKIIRGLGQLRAHLAKRTRAQRVLAEARRNLVKAVHFMSLRMASERDHERDETLSTEGGDLLLAVLHDKEEHATDRAVRLVGLLHAANVTHNIRQALSSRDPRRRADSIELLTHKAPRELGQALSALLDQSPEEQRLRRAADALGEVLAQTSYEKRLEQMLNDRSEAVRAVAAYHVRELGLPSLVRALPPASEQRSTLSREVLARASEAFEAVRLAPVRVRRP